MSSFLSWVAGTTTSNNSGKSIDLFLTQLESMPKLLDKRQSVNDLYDAIKQAPGDVPSSVIPRLIYVIGTGIDDEEILQKILDILCFLTELKQVENAEVLLIENVSTLLCEYSYVEILLSLFDCSDVWVRMSAIQILKNCIAVNQSIVEKSILGCPMGLQKLVDVLKDKREEVRNEMLLLLRSLTRRNDEICKFIAFQDGFDILISILIQEKGSISRDCLNIIYNMVVNSVLTLKLFSQKKYLTAIIDILSSYTHMGKSADLAVSPRSDDSDMFSKTIQIQDQVIDLTKYNELEILHNFDIQCFQFAISILELLLKDDKYVNDEENYAIAKPVLEQNRTILHSYSVYVFDILYFTLYQIKEEPLEPIQENVEEQRRNAIDLEDVAEQCESLLGLVFTDSTTNSIFTDLLKVTVFTRNGCFDLLSFLLNGFLESNINTVHSQGYYTNSSIFVRLFLLLFQSNDQLKQYLINKESESGDVLKNTWIRNLIQLVSEREPEDQSMNQFKLILSVYKECCKTNSESFMELFVSDVLMTELAAELEYRKVKEEMKNEPTDAPSTDKEVVPNEVLVEPATEDMTSNKTPEEVTVETEVGKTEEVSVEASADRVEEVVSGIEVDTTTDEVTYEDKPVETAEEDKQDTVPTETTSSEIVNENPTANNSALPTESSDSIHPSPLVTTPTEMSIKKKDKKCGEYLWLVLTRLVISKSLPINMTIELSELLCLAIVNNPNKNDSIYNNLPFINHLIDLVHHSITEHTIFTPVFDVQLSCYSCLFLLLSLLYASKQAPYYLQLLDNQIGLEQLCSLSIRFFFLSKVREFINNETRNAINVIGFDFCTISVFHTVFTQFKTTLFGYYLNMSVPMEETQLVIDNYKQLIRIQDNQLQTFDLLKKGGNSGIEVVEELKTKDNEIEDLKKKQISLEQDVFDWKERFSQKEESLRSKEQECEQLEYSLNALQNTTAEEKTQYENSIVELKDELEKKENEFKEYREEKENEMNTFLVNLNKKQEQINMLDDASNEYERTISDLRQEIQNRKESNHYSENELKNQIISLRQELESSQDEVSRLQKKWNTLRNDYDALEDELTQTKNDIMSMNRNSKEQQYLAEIEKLKTNQDELEMLVNVLRDEKKRMEDLVRSLSPVTPSTPTPREQDVSSNPVEESASAKADITAETFFNSSPNN